MAKKKNKNTEEKVFRNEIRQVLADRGIEVGDRSLDTSKTKRLKDPILKYNFHNTKFVDERNKFIFPEYNFSQLEAIIETEGFVARAFERKHILCIKEGWSIAGKNQKFVDYIEKRLTEIQRKTGITFKQLIHDAVNSLIKYSNYFLVTVRDRNASSGLVRKENGKRIDPIAGLYSVPIQTVTMRYDLNGDIDAIRQELYPHNYWNTYYYETKVNENPIFTKKNFMHCPLWPTGGNSVATPILIGIIEDIKSLRRIEENTELLVYQYLFPLYHYKIGTENMPAEVYPDGTTEVDRYANLVAELPSEGAIVTSERHAVEVVGAQKAALDPVPFMEWFKRRVFAGLAASALDYGEGDTANRSTSDNLSRLIIDYCKYIQRQVSSFIEDVLFMELLKESTFNENELYLKENKVYLQWKEIDVEEQIKRENHDAQMFSLNAINHDEMRVRFGAEIVDDVLNETNKYMIGLSGKQLSDQTEAAAKLAANKEKPTNQHKTNSGPTKRKSSFQRDSANPLENELGYFYNSWMEVLDKIARLPKTIKTPEYVSNLILVQLSATSDRFYDKLLSDYSMGWREVSNTNPTLSLQDSRGVKDSIDNVMNNFFKDIRSRLSTKDKEEIDYCLESFTWRARLIDRTEAARALNYGRYKGYINDGITSFEVYDENNKTSIEAMEGVSLSYRNMPPKRHPNSFERVRSVSQ